MTVVIDGAQHISVYEGTTYFFCGKGCRLEFEEDPQRYLAPGYQPSMGWPPWRARRRSANKVVALQRARSL